ncbi:MAG: pyridoxal-phosphate dependent enzyme [Polyangia bacterium]
MAVAPKLSLGTFPTPIERLRGLVSDRIELWVKREDLSGAAYGGNKVRKLEYLLCDALALGRKRVVTIGGWGSNHALATAIYARQLGLACELLLFPQPRDATVETRLARMRETGADVRELASYVALVVPLLAARLDADTYYVAAGGSSVLGSLGWVDAAHEIASQLEPDLVYLALGSCGTVAGLLAGYREVAHAPTIVGVRVVDRPFSGYGPARRLEDAIVSWRDTAHLPPTELLVVHDQIGRGYGYATEASIAAVEAGRRCGLALETTYTGKALAALMADAASGALDGKCVLFVDTYGGREQHGRR